MRERNYIRSWIGYLIMVAGLCVLASPFVQGFIDGSRQKKVVEQFLEEDLNVEDTSGTDKQKETASSATETESESESEGEMEDPGMTQGQMAFYEAAAAYNEELYATGQSGLISTEATEYFPLNATDYGYSQNMIGTLWIPRMNVELGLYLGANTGNMAQGAALFGQTSVPLGRPNENASIAGHRGWRGTPMFRDIQELQMGDAIYLTCAWGTLLYRVCDIRIVTPEDHSWCMIQEGETLITLMTCHPYTDNYQRYIVFGRLESVLDKNALQNDDERSAAIQEAADTLDESVRTVKEYAADGSVKEAKIDPAAIDPDGSEYGTVWSNTIILAEKTIFRITLVLTAVILLIGIRLTCVTISGIKERKRK